jgi:hypothetical protein
LAEHIRPGLSYRRGIHPPVFGTTPISISAIVVLARQSSPFNHFLDGASWLLLAPDALFWELAGTILGTVVDVDDAPPQISQYAGDRSLCIIAVARKHRSSSYFSSASTLTAGHSAITSKT